MVSRLMDLGCSHVGTQTDLAMPISSLATTELQANSALDTISVSEASPQTKPSHLPVVAPAPDIGSPP